MTERRSRKTAVLDIDRTRLTPPTRKVRKKLLAAPSVTDLANAGGHRLDPFLMKHLEETGVLLMSADELLRQPEVKPFMDDMAAGTRVDRSGALRASSANNCPRSQVFGYLNVPRYEPESFDSRQALIFSDGQFRHIRWQAIVLAAQRGKLKAATMEVPLSAPCPGYESVEVRGHVDGLLDWDGRWVGLEIKGTRDISWVFDAPAKDHVWQVHTYALLTYLAIGIPIEQFVILYESKSTQEVREHLINITPETTNAVLTTLQSTAQAITSGALPDIIKPCESSNTTTFFDCPWHHVCHGIPSADAAAALAPKSP